MKQIVLGWMAPAYKAVMVADSTGKARVTFRWTALPDVIRYSHNRGA